MIQTSGRFVNSTCDFHGLMSMTVWREAFCALLLCALAAFAIVFPAAALIVKLQGSPFAFWSSVFGGFIWGSVCAVGLWLSWGKTHLLLRVVIAEITLYLVSYMMVLGLGESSEGFAQLLPQVATIIIVVSLATAVPRLLGIRYFNIHEPQALQSSRQRIQFSVRDLLLWTTTCAVIAAATPINRLRWLYFDEAELGIDILIWATGLAGSTLAAAWLMLSVRKISVSRTVVATGIAMLCALLVYSRENRHSFAIAASFTVETLMSFFVLIVPLCLLRCRGHRWTRQQSGSPD